MSIRCDQCGYENSENYRFCGMCGALLKSPTTQKAAPPPAPEPPPRRQTSVSGPSFLGLSEPARERDVSYLLEDEESHGHGALYFVLVLLLIGAGAAAWHWRQQAYPWIAKLRSSVPITSDNQVSTVVPPSDTSQTAAPPVGGGASTAPAPSEPLAPSAGPTQSSSTPPPLPSSGEGHMAGSQGEAAALQQEKQPEPQAQTAAPPTQESAPQQTATAKPAPSESTADTSTEAAAQPESSDAANPPATKEARATKPSRTPEPAAKPEKSTAAQPPAVSREDRLVSEGEKYLYGNGVPQDCARAQRNLNSAAARANPKAMGVLATMYATGHCVSRDLPTAYRWFAKALHQEPDNDRIQRDLEVLWRQMSPQERQIAMQNR